MFLISLVRQRIHGIITEKIFYLIYIGTNFNLAN